MEKIRMTNKSQISSKLTLFPMAYRFLIGKFLFPLPPPKKKSKYFCFLKKVPYLAKFVYFDIKLEILSFDEK